jgi:hypothetical protein
MKEEGITPEQLARRHLLTQQNRATLESAARLERYSQKEERRKQELEYPSTLTEFLFAKEKHPFDPTYESGQDDDDNDTMFSTFQWSVSESTPTKDRVHTRRRSSRILMGNSPPKLDVTLEDSSKKENNQKNSSSRSRSSSLEGDKTRDSTKSKKKKKKSSKDEKSVSEKKVRKRSNSSSPLEMGSRVAATERFSSSSRLSRRSLSVD